MPWLKWAAALLALAVIGLLYMMFVPALNGKLPEVSLLISLYFLLGLIFTSIAMLRGKIKSKGFVNGVLIAMVFMYMVEGVAAYNEKLKIMERDLIIEEVNKQFPKMLDDETRLDKVSIDYGLAYRYHITTVNLSLSEISVDDLTHNYKKLVLPLVCSNSFIQNLFDEGYNVEYAYKDKSGVPIRTYIVTSKDCI